MPDKRSFKEECGHSIGRQWNSSLRPCLSCDCLHNLPSTSTVFVLLHLKVRTCPFDIFMADLRLSQANHRYPRKLRSLFRSLNRIFGVFDGLNIKMVPAIGPEIQPIALSIDRGQGNSPYSAPLSSSSLSVGGSRRTITRSASSLSIPFDDEEVDVVRVEGVRHAGGRLEAR